MKRCFVISPIGEEGSEIRAHADDVFEFIIKPAMEECGIEAWRSDQKHESGKISDQMFRAILNDDLCIALLTGYNPNVFYELAIAHCAARPVIILAEKGQVLPFDIRDMRCVYYDLSPRPLFVEKVYTKQVISHVKSLDASGWQSVCPFDGFAARKPDNAATNQYKFVEKEQNYRTFEQWAELVHETEEVFEIMSVSLAMWRRVRGLRELIIQKAKAGCKVRVLLMHEENPALTQLVNRTILQKSYESVLVANREALQFFVNIAEQAPGMEVRQMRNGCPHSRLTRTDKVASWLPYFYGEKGNYLPLWEAPVGSPLYMLVQQEFEALWQANEREAGGN